MPLAEPGRYDDIANTVHWKTKARFVAVIVMGGDRGTGASFCGMPELVPLLPDFLRQVANDIEAGRLGDQT